MNASKTKPFRYLIAYLLDDLSVGAKFKPSALHIIILPWFALETDEEPFIKWFYSHFGMLHSFDAKVGQKAMFGPKKDAPVSLIGPAPEFMKMHKLALSWFGRVGARWAERDPYVGDDYIAHITQRKGYVLKEGDSIRISSLSLFKANRREDDIRIVAAKAIFNG